MEKNFQLFFVAENELKNWKLFSKFGKKLPILLFFSTYKVGSFFPILEKNFQLLKLKVGSFETKFSKFVEKVGSFELAKKRYGPHGPILGGG